VARRDEREKEELVEDKRRREEAKGTGQEKADKRRTAIPL